MPNPKLASSARTTQSRLSSASSGVRAIARPVISIRLEASSRRSVMPSYMRRDTALIRSRASSSVGSAVPKTDSSSVT